MRAKLHPRTSEIVPRRQADCFPIHIPKIIATMSAGKINTSVFINLFKISEPISVPG